VARQIQAAAFNGHGKNELRLPNDSIVIRIGTRAIQGAAASGRTDRVRQSVVKFPAARRSAAPVTLPAEAALGPGWEGRFLLLPIAERDLAWMLERCREHTRGRHDLAFARLLAL
jgi:hypothetical protein